MKSYLPFDRKWSDRMKTISVTVGIYNEELYNSCFIRTLKSTMSTIC